LNDGSKARSKWKRGGGAEEHIPYHSDLVNSNSDHLDWGNWTILRSLGTVDSHDDVLSVNNTTKDGMLGGGASIKEVQKAVVDSVDEELTSTRVWLTSVGHGNGKWLVR
jgi:hypothetical protein